MMDDNPIVMEVRKAREQLLDAYQGDYRAMLRTLMKRQGEAGKTIVKAPSQPSEENRKHSIYPPHA